MDTTPSPDQPLIWTNVHVQHLSAEELSLRQSVELLMQRVTRLESDLTLLLAQQS